MTPLFPELQAVFDRERKDARAARSPDAATARAGTVRMYGRLAELQAGVVARKGIDVACARGCSYCCHLRVEVFAHEAAALLQHLRTQASPEEAASIRSPQISTVEELGAQIAEVRAAAGRDLFLQTHTPQTSYFGGGFSVEEHRDHLGRLAEAGVGHFVVRPSGTSVEAVVDELHTYADTFFGVAS